MPNDAKGSPATGWPEGTVAVSYLALVRIEAIAVLCPFSLEFFLGSVKPQCLGLVRSRDFIRECWVP